MNATVDAPVSTEPEKASFFEDLIDIIIAPAKVFARRLDRAVFLTIVIFTALSLVIAFANRGTIQAAAEGEGARAAERALAQNPETPPEALQISRSITAFFVTYSAAVLPIYFLVLGLIVWLVAKIFGVSVGFGTALMVTTWSFVPRILSYLTITLQGFLMDTSTLTSVMQFTLSPARFFDPATTNVGVLGLLARLDLFLLWQTVLIGIGLSVASRLPRSKGITVAIAVWVLCSLPVAFGLLQG
jgi:hypothetical protein